MAAKPSSGRLARRSSSFTARALATPIHSYRDKRTRELAEGKRIREFEGFRRQVEKCLDILDAATSLADLRALTSNALEGLKGDRKGQYGIRINMHWRICFVTSAPEG